MRWTGKQLEQHHRAVSLLIKIKNEVFSLFDRKSRNISEYEVQQFLLRRFKHHKLKKDKEHPPIVAFRENTSHVHYFPSPYCLKLRKNSLILLDIFASLNEKRAPFADITWMAYYGAKVPVAVKEVFDIVAGARDIALKEIKKNLRGGVVLTGGQIDSAVRDYIRKRGYGENFLHSTGHVLGNTSPHGSARPINRKNNHPIHKEVGYTIEPGIYLKERFGVRSEINFLVDKMNKLIVTTPIQRKITGVKPR